MKKLVVSTLAVMLLGTVGVPATQADHTADVHSDNVSLVGTFDDGGEYTQGSDIAFWGDRGFFGNYGGFRIIDLATLTEVAQFDCPGSQGDVSVWKNLVFVSVDGPRAGPECGAPAATNDQVAAGTAWEGVRVVDISKPARPVQIAAVPTDCGSHTHTLLPQPKRKRLLIYVGSYPLTGHYGEGEQGTECNQHEKISVIRVRLKKPQSAKVVSEPSVSPAVGCHDITVVVPRKIAGAACISESQLWDISDPLNPVILSHIENPQINIHHSSAFSNDGGTLVLGDELAGATVFPGCTGGNAPQGALWFYDVTDLENPVQQSFWRIPRAEASAACTAHNFNVVPLTTDQDVLVASWYEGGTTIVDFTDPTAPTELGYYKVEEGVPANSWSSYFYRGRIYANNLPAGGGIHAFDTTIPELEGAVSLKRLNPQTQQFVG